ncbi:hypothetical protein JHK87_000809 [Glycine soja]|nr:hypothetical protein JHK87_000809 [Glycine soja]
MLEVYIGNLRDLLSPRQSGRPHEQYMTKCNLNIQTDSKGLIEIEGLSKVQISDYAKPNGGTTRANGSDPPLGLM